MGQMVLKAVGHAIEIIPKVLAQNCGADAVRMITELRAKHAVKGNERFGINGNTREIADMGEACIWEPILVAGQVLKTSIEASSMLLRIDDIISGVKKREKEQPKSKYAPEEAAETFGDARDG
jgi:T-complex protein 1 subunit gamma